MTEKQMRLKVRSLIKTHREMSDNLQIFNYANAKNISADLGNRLTDLHRELTESIGDMKFDYK